MVAIGGIGGSGTRLIAQILQEIGYFIGEDINRSNDNLLFTLLFKRESILVASNEEFDICVTILGKLMNSNESLNMQEEAMIKQLAQYDRTLHDKAWLQERAKSIKIGQKHTLWGWKEPNTHIVIEKLFERMEHLKFIYVYRSGLDMAYSNNQNQLQLWGGIFFNAKNIEINPRNSLKYWCTVHRRILKLQESYPNRVLMLDFDKLCLAPDEVLKAFLLFINHQEIALEKLKSLIKVPSSIGRYKNYPLKNFDSTDIEFVKSIQKG